MTTSPPYGRSVPGNAWNLLDGVRPATPPMVSVIVVHYRQQEELDRTLAALARQSHPANRLEVIVVDDGSPEVPAVPAGVRLIRQADEGFRLAAARNLGVRAARGDVLVFLDADTAPEPKYVERLVRLPALLPEAVTVGHRKHTRLAGSSADEPIELVAPARELPEPAWLTEEYRRTGNLLEADQRSYRFIIGAVIACSRWLFDEVGGFDESFREYGGEDWEWAHRAWLDGAVFAHVPDAVAWHDGPDWAGRDGVERQRRKNDETLRLSRLIPVTGSRGRGLRPATVDILVRLEAAPSDASAFLCVDSILAILPAATIVVPDDRLPLFAADQRVVGAMDLVARDARPRVELLVPAPIRVDGAGRELVSAVDEVGTSDLGTVEFGAEPGPMITVRSRRAQLRHRRWGPGSFRSERQPCPWLRSVDEEPGLAAYLGGWG